MVKCFLGDRHLAKLFPYCCRDPTPPPPYPVNLHPVQAAIHERKKTRGGIRVDVRVNPPSNLHGIPRLCAITRS